MPFHTLPDGDRLCYEVHGSGPPLLLVSGLTGIAAFWHPQLPAFSPRFTCILHDHRGCGRSSLPLFEYSVAQMADDLRALMDGLGIDRAHFVGHSTGGAIGQVLAIERPERIGRLLLSASWPGKDPYFDLLFHVRSLVLRAYGAGEYLRQTVLVGKPPTWLLDHPEEAALPDAETVRAVMPDPECTLRRIAALRAYDRRADLHKVRAATLVTGTADDMVTPVHLLRELAQRIPGARLDILESGGHFYPVTRAAAFRAQVLGFLQEG